MRPTPTATSLPKRMAFRSGLAFYQATLSIAARLPWRYPRFLALHWRAERELDRGHLDHADQFARELLSIAESYRDDWNYGNAVHKGHLILGRIALKRGDKSTARSELLLAGDTPGSPQLDSFGPNMRLARELLEVGERTAVLEYFERCRRFWQLGAPALARWTAAIEASRAPDFGPNLRY